MGRRRADYLDLFNARAPAMQVGDRDGRIQFDNVKWRRPVVMLVNERTRSGKEVLAYGFEKYRLGEVIGSRTSGAVLAARAFLMRNGDLLLLAVDDVRVDGERWREPASARQSRFPSTLGTRPDPTRSSIARSRCCRTGESGSQRRAKFDRLDTPSCSARP